jgi:membrane protein implicated in regulation of membrane protease activity
MDWLDGIEAHWVWITLGLLLCGVEMLVPGIYLVWLGVAAMATGAIIFINEPPLAVQVIIFVSLSLIFAYSSKRWLRDQSNESTDPLLNRRGARLAGETALVTQAIVHGAGRVKLGDSEWIAHGPDMAVGERVRVYGSEGAILLVEAVGAGGRVLPAETTPSGQ